MADVFEVGFPEGVEVIESLRGVDLDPAELDFAVFSHLHFGHCGGLHSCQTRASSYRAPNGGLVIFPS